MVIIGEVGVLLFVVLLYVVPTELTDDTEAYGLKLFESTLSLQKKATQSHKQRNNQGKTMIAKDSFVPLL